MIDELKEKVGVIDIGSNTIRLVIYEYSFTGSQLREVENFKVSARLRTFLDEHHALNKKGISLLIDTLRNFRIMIQQYGVTDVFCVATATIRQASNQEDVIQIIKEKTGFTTTLLSEYEESYYGFLAVIHSMNIQEGITIDMGGASTEITYFCNRELVHYQSLPFGSLSLTLQFVKGDLPTHQESLEIGQYIRSQLENLPWLVNKQVPIIAIGGSARNVVQLHQNLITYPIVGIHQYEMAVSELQEVSNKLTLLSFDQLQKVEGLSKERADTILPAIEAFKVISDLSNATRFVLSRKGLREGLLYKKKNLVNGQFSLFEDSIQELVQILHIDSDNAKHITKIANMFYEQMKNIEGIGPDFTEDDLAFLKYGAPLFHLGQKVNEESISHQTFHLLANQTILGLSHKERVKLALIVSYKGKGTLRKYIEPFKNWYTKDEQKKIALLGAILKVSQSLNTTKRNIVNNIKITAHDMNWIIAIQCQDIYKPEEFQMEKQKKHLEKLLKVTITLNFIDSY